MKDNFIDQNNLLIFFSQELYTNICCKLPSTKKKTYNNIFIIWKRSNRTECSYFTMSKQTKKTFDFIKNTIFLFLIRI